MVMFNSLTMSTLLLHMERNSWFEWWWTLTMLGMRLTDVPARATWSMCKRTWFIGSPRTKILLRKLSLDPNLSPWHMELKHCVGFIISSACWVFQFMDLLTSLDTICLLFSTHPYLNLNWERNRILFFTMLSISNCFGKMHDHKNPYFAEFCGPTNKSYLWR